MRLFKLFAALLALFQFSAAGAQDTVARGLAVQALQTANTSNQTSSKLTKLYGDGIASPASNVSYAAGSAGVLTGTYTYNVTYVTALGETAPWSGTPAQVTLSSQQMSLSSIPIGPAGVLKRRIYRSKANPGEVKNTYFLTEIADNTTTTFTDNVADGSLGSPVGWIPGNMGLLATANGTALSFSDSGSVIVGGLSKAGYAGISIGGQAGAANINGFRNVLIGAYAGGNNQSGVENVCVGTHACQAPTGVSGTSTGIGNTVIGTYAMQNSGSGGNQNYNVVIGHGAMNGFIGAGYGATNVYVGYHAGYNANTADNVIGIGAYAGKDANASRQVFIDNQDRSTLANAQDVGLIYCKTASGTTHTVAVSQECRLNALTRIGGGGAVVSDLPTCSSTWKNYQGTVTDATVAYTSANIGSTVAGGGSNAVKVFCNGSAWVIG